MSSRTFPSRHCKRNEQFKVGNIQTSYFFEKFWLKLSDYINKGLFPVIGKIHKQRNSCGKFDELFLNLLAKLFACYKVGNSVPDTPDAMPKDFPHQEWFQGENAYFDLEHIDLLKDYEGRLTIDWGNSARMWHQKGTTEKPIVAIQADEKKVFSGFENLILTYDELKEIVENPTIYEAWHTALSSVNAIYLIVDQETGKQYVGSAYGKDGLLGRWSCYVNSLHGNNKLMKELICAYPERYHHFQFSILQILPKTATDDEVIQTESLYKKKLLTIPFGMNDN